MKSMSRYKKSVTSTNVWLFDFCLIVSMLFRCIAIFFMQLVKIIILLTFRCHCVSLILFLADRLLSGADRAQEKQF